MLDVGRSRCVESGCACVVDSACLEDTEPNFKLRGHLPRPFNRGKQGRFRSRGSLEMTLLQVKTYCPHPCMYIDLAMQLMDTSRRDIARPSGNWTVL